MKILAEIKFSWTLFNLFHNLNNKEKSGFLDLVSLYIKQVNNNRNGILATPMHQSQVKTELYRMCDEYTQACMNFTQAVKERRPDATVLGQKTLVLGQEIAMLQGVYGAK